MLDSDYERHVSPRLRAAMQRLRDPQAVWNIFRDDETVAEMEQLTARKRPAVTAASTKLVALGDWVRDKDARKTFGGIARCVMEADGYLLAKRGVDTADDPLFTKGALYRSRDHSGKGAEAATLHIRDLAPDLHARLSVRAARNGRSIEAEALHILSQALAPSGRGSGRNLAEAIHRRFAAVGGLDELPSLPPVSTEPPVEFEA